MAACEGRLSPAPWIIQDASPVTFEQIAFCPVGEGAMKTGVSTALVAVGLAGVGATPHGFPKSGNGLWYTEPGTGWLEDYLPIGNGFLAGTVRFRSPQSCTDLFDAVDNRNVTRRNLSRDNTVEYRVSLVWRSIPRSGKRSYFPVEKFGM